MVEGRLKTKWVIVIVPLMPYFSCLGHLPKCCSRPRPNISHYKAVSVCACVCVWERVCVCVLVVQPWPLMARVWQRPFVSFMVSLGWGSDHMYLSELHSDLLQIIFFLFALVCWSVPAAAAAQCTLLITAYTVHIRLCTIERVIYCPVYSGAYKTEAVVQRYNTCTCCCDSFMWIRAEQLFCHSWNKKCKTVSASNVKIWFLLTFNIILWIILWIEYL